jgi:predicted MFS family arabinose efflux permease
LVLAVLCAVSVANIYYAQPLLERIGTDLSIPAGRVGWVVAVGQAGYLVGLAALVPLGDWLNRRALISVQLVLAAAGTAIAAISTSATGLLVGVGIAGVFSTVVQIAVAYAATLSEPSERGRNIGLVTSGVVVGIIMARTVAGLVADLSGWRTVYAASTVASLAMAAIAWRLLPGEQRRQGPHSYTRTVFAIVILGASNRVFRVRAAIAFFLFASFGVLWSGMALPLSHAPWHLSTAQIGLFGFAGLAGTLGAARAGHWSDHGKAAPVTVGALVLLIASWWFIAGADRSLWLLAIGAVLLDFAVQAVHVTNQNLIVATTPQTSSRTIGAYMICYSLGSALGAVTTTALYQHSGWAAAAALGACYATGALSIWTLDRLLGARAARGQAPTRRPESCGSQLTPLESTGRHCGAAPEQ